MNASKLSTVERLAEELVARLTIELEASGRHVHLSRADVETLFGAGYRLNRTKDLSQPGQFACAERVTLEGPRGSLKNVVILGPERPESQVEISLTDAVALGLTPPVRLSGDTEGTPGLTLRHGDRVLRLSRGLIVAKRHIHMTPEDAARFGVADRQRVRLQCFYQPPAGVPGRGGAGIPPVFHGGAYRLRRGQCVRLSKGRPGRDFEMTLEWRGRTLVITWLPVASMGRLAACAPQTAAETEVLAALLAGARVRVERDALEYRRYRRTAPLGIYQKCAGLERRLREMGICVAGTGGR